MKRFNKKAERSKSSKPLQDKKFKKNHEEQDGLFSPKANEAYFHGSFKPKVKPDTQSLHYLRKNAQQKQYSSFPDYDETKPQNIENDIRESAQSLAHAMRDALNQACHFPLSHDNYEEDYLARDYSYKISQGGIIYGDETGTHHCPHIKPLHDDEE